MKHYLKHCAVLIVAGSCLMLSGCMPYAARQYVDGQKAFAMQDYHSAFEDLLHAASYNNTQAQYAVGYMYYYGIGTEQSDYLARLWLYRSASFGNAKAIAALQAMDRAMPQALQLMPAPRSTRAVQRLPVIPVPRASIK